MINFRVPAFLGRGGIRSRPNASAVHIDGPPVGIFAAGPEETVEVAPESRSGSVNRVLTDEDAGAEAVDSNYLYGLALVAMLEPFGSRMSEAPLSTMSATRHGRSRERPSCVNASVTSTGDAKARKYSHLPNSRPSLLLCKNTPTSGPTRLNLCRFSIWHRQSKSGCTWSSVMSAPTR
jgi:hypothetical protein